MSWINDMKKIQIHRKRNTVFFMLGIASVIVIGGYFVFIAPLLPFNSPDYAFIKAMLDGNNLGAEHYMADSLQESIINHCPDRLLSSCIDELVQESWGDYSEIYFAIGSGSRNTTLYHIFWHNLERPMSLVILHEEIDGQDLVVGWRGFIVSEGETEDALILRGDRTDNQFP